MMQQLRLSGSGLTPSTKTAARPLSACAIPHHLASSRKRTPICHYRESAEDAATTSTPQQQRKTATQQSQTAVQEQQQQHDLREQQRQQRQTGPTPLPRRAVVIGAGPAGMTAAMHLAAAGYQVDVVERRGHPAEMETDKRRTYLIGLGERGLSSLDKLGITLGPEVGRRMQGSVYAYKSGKRIEDPFTPDTRIIGVDRQGLTAFLVDEATSRFSSSPPSSSPQQQQQPQPQPQAGDDARGSITFHFNVSPPGLDLQGKHVRFVSRESNQRSGSPIELPYDLLVGADGAGSSVRAALEAQVDSVQVRRLTSPVASMEYKAFTGLPWNEAITAMLPDDARGPGAGMVFMALTNPSPDKPSPGSITLYCLKDWAGTMYLPEGTYSQLQGVEEHEAAIRQFTPPGFPEAWVPLMAQQMAQTPPNRISPMYLVSHLATPEMGVVLLGDAGHCVTPQMGQGCNSALEDSVLLAQALEGAGHDIQAGLAAFERTRTPQVHALQHMEEENAWVRRPPRWLSDPLDKSLARVCWVSFFMLLPLLRALPGMKGVVHASMFQNIMSTTTPYNTLHTLVRVAPLVWVALLAGGVVAARAVFAGGAAVLAHLH